jgi:hypothetical protein
MKRLTMILAATLIAVLGAGTAMAQNPHFLSASATGPNANGSLTCKFKIAGLGSNETATITCSANADAIYGCENNAGNFPNAANKQELTGTVSASGQFTSGMNGQISNTLTLGPPASTLSCPSGQTRVLCSVSYTDVQVSGAGDTKSISGTFSRTYFPSCL